MGRLEAIEVLYDGYLERRISTGKWVSELAKLNPDLKHVPGVTYLCRLPNGYLKVGTSQSVGDRMRKLKAELIYYLEGGESLELQAHYELAAYRIPSRGELFFDREEVVEWFKSRQPILKMGAAQDVMDSTYQTCSQCGQGKSLRQFGTHRTAKSGYYSQCKACRFSKLPPVANVQNYITGVFGQPG